MKGTNIQSYLWSLIVLVLVVLVNMLAGLYHFKIDLTEEKRYTLTPATVNLLGKVENPVLIDVTLEGEFPAGFKRLQLAVREILEEFQSINNNITFRFTDPLVGDPEEVNAKLEDWAQVGIVPTELNVRETDGQSSRRIYPFAIFNYADRQIAINLLEANMVGITPEMALNNSVSLLEYKLSNAIAKLRTTHKPNILFTEGHGELTSLQTASLEGNLRAFYNTGSINLDSIYQIPEDIAMLIIAKPTMPYSEKDLFKIDQFIMRGGNVVFLIDPLVVNLDSIGKNGQYVPYDNNVGFDEMFFKYGVKVNSNLVLDLECGTIPLALGDQRSNNAPRLVSWYYHPLVSGREDHPIVKGLDRIHLQFPSTIDTVKTKNYVRKTPLLTSSPYTRLQFSPVILDFEILKIEPDPDQFNKGPQTVAMMLEGTFNSLYENRVAPEMRATLDQIGASFQGESSNSKILVVADGDIAKNLINPTNGAIRPLGYNQYMNYTFDNQDFLTNAIEYMLDSEGLIESRARNIKLRLLDKPRIAQERLYWQLLNVVLPLILLSAFGIFFHFRRKRKYARFAA